MKKIKLLLFILLFIPFFVCAETCDKNSITIKSIDLENSTNGVVEEASIVDNKISLNLSMNEVNDVVEYRLVIKNTSKEDFVLDKDSFNNNTNYIKYTIDTEDNSNVIKGNSEKEVLLKVIYENEVPDDVLSDNKYNDSKSLVLNLTNDKNGIINPKTGDINRVLIVISILVCGLILYLYVNKKQFKFFIFLLCLIPLTISATCITSIDVDSKVVINKKDTTGYLMGAPSGDENSNYLRTNIKKKTIESITFTNSLSGHTLNDSNCFDVSRDEDGNVLAWVTDTDNDGKYEITIGAKGTVYATDGNGLFNNLINMSNLSGMQYLDTTLVDDMQYMFGNCNSLTNIDLSNFNTSKTTNMNSIFSGCNNLEALDVTNFDTTKVTNMNSMFNNCLSLTSLDLSNFDTSRVTNMDNMFSGSSNLKTIYANDSFDITNVTTSDNMFNNCLTIVGGNGTTYAANHIDKEYARVDTDETPGYFTLKNGKTATFYYNSNNESGELTVSKVSVKCTTEEGSSSCTVDIPSVVTSSVGKYNSQYKGISDEFGNLSNASLTINTNKRFYAYYSSEVTNYLFNPENGERTLYRNEFFNSIDDMSTVLSTSVTGTENYVASGGPNESDWIGLSSAQDTTVEYNNISDAAKSDANTLYTIYQYRISYEKGLNISEIGSITDSCNITSFGISCYITLPSVTPEEGYTSVGWGNESGSTTGTSSGTQYLLNTNNKVLYANAYIGNYQNTTTNVLYESLKTALAQLDNNQEIKVLKDTTENEKSNSSSSSTKLDLNGHTITITINPGLEITSGSLDIYNSNSAEGKILFTENSTSDCIINSRTLTINQTSKNNVTKIQTTSTNTNSLINNKSGLTVYDNSYILNENGRVVSSNRVSSSRITIEGGTVSGKTGIRSFLSGQVTIKGGHIIGKEEGIYTENSSLIIGVNDSTVSTTSPIIEATGTNHCYAINAFNASSSVQFSFYDGIAKSASGTGYATTYRSDLGSSSVSTPENYSLYEETIDGVESAYLVKPSVLMYGTDSSYSSNYLRTNIKKQNIESITFTNSVGGRSPNGTDCFDVSKDQDGSVLAWATDSDSNGKYELTIGGHGKVYAAGGSYLFANLLNISSINGLEFLDTSKATSMNSMFYQCKELVSLDLSHFDTSKVTKMESMFRSCSKLVSLDLSNFNTGSVTTMYHMFSGCSGLTSLNLSNFDTSNVTVMNSMFENCSSLTTLDLNSFDTSNVIEMGAMFRNCSSLVSVDLSSFNTKKVKTMGSSFTATIDSYRDTSRSGMFDGCSSLVSLDLSSFSTESLNSIGRMFADCTSLQTLILGDFKNANVDYMIEVFSNCTSLTNINLSNFKTDNAIDMRNMFYNCSSLTSLDLRSFNTSKVTNMSRMFQECNSLVSLDLRNFNTSSVISMFGMFYSCSNLLNLDISSFNTSSVIKMNSMFYNCSNLSNLDISSFDTSSVETMAFMFDACSSLTALDLSHFNTENVVSMELMFYGCKKLAILDVSSFSTPKVTTMRYMFSNCKELVTLDISNFTAVSLTNTECMFDGASKLSTIYASDSFDLTNYNIGLPWNMFQGCSSLVGGQGTAYSSSNPKDKTYAHIDGGSANPGYFTGKGGILAQGNSGTTTFFNSSPINKSDVESITFQRYIIEPSGSLGSWDASLDLDNSVMAYYTDTDSDNKYEVIIASNGMIYAPEDSSYLLSYFYSLESINGMEYFETSLSTNMADMFLYDSSLISIDVSHFDTSNVTNMTGMFQASRKPSYGEYQTALVSIDGLNNFNTSNVTSMYSMFHNCTKLTTLDLSSFDTSKVVYMSCMFCNCISLTSLDLSSFDTSNVEEMEWMFAGNAYEFGDETNHIMIITHIYGIENFDTSKVTSMQGMFRCCRNLLELDLSGWDTSKVTRMGKMFQGYSNKTSLDLSSFDTSNVTDMSYMFSGCTNLVTIYVSDKFVTSSITSSNRMFEGCASLVGGAGTTYTSSNPANKTYARIDVNGTPGYFTESNGYKVIIHYNSNRNDGELTPDIKIVSCTPAENETTCMITLPAEVTGSIGKYNSSYVGVSNNKYNMTPSNLIIDEYTHLYAIYSSNVTYHYYDENNTWNTKTLHRNEMFNNSVNMIAILASNITDDYGYDYDDDYNPGNSNYYGLSASQDTTFEYGGLEDAAYSSVSELYNVFGYYVLFEIGSNVESIGSNESICYFTKPDTTCSIILPTITPKEDYTSVGWSITNGDTTGIPALSLYTPEDNITLYANAVKLN